jgi:hypothetical protein
MVKLGGIKGLIMAAAIAVGFYATPASAQATRTWVSGVGDDANPCSRTAPCKTFAGAISKTAAGGEINCLDPGGFGGVTITKSISIICLVEAGVLVSGTNAIVVNAGVNDVVVLDGLDIEGVGTGLNGIRFLAGRSLHVRNTTISGFNSASAGSGNGISFAPTGNSELYVTDTTITDTGATNNGSAIDVTPSSTGSARVSIRNVRLLDNANNGIRINTTGVNNVQGLVASIDSTEIAGNGNAGLSLVAGPTTLAAMLVNSTVFNNSGVGVVGSGVNAIARVGNTTITRNGIGVQANSSSQILSYGTNRLNGNDTDGAFNSIINQQ